MPIKGTFINGMTLEGNVKLASMVEEYWKKRGYRGIKASAVMKTFVMKEPAGKIVMPVVVSNIGPTGYPPIWE